MFSGNSAKNPFAGANLALLGYCSSDAFAGDGVAQFAGVRIRAPPTPVAAGFGLKSKP